MAQSTQLIKDRIAKLLSEGRLDKTPFDYLASIFFPPISFNFFESESVSNALFSKDRLQDL